MTPQEAWDFIRGHRRAVLATRFTDGRVQLSPVGVTVDDDDTLLVSSRETAVKTRNLRRDPYAVLCVLRDQFYPPWAFAEGWVSIESLPDAMETLVRYYRLIAGEHPDWDDYRRAMVREQRCILRLHVERVGPTREG